MSNELEPQEMLSGTPLIVCAGCGDELEEPEGGVPPDHELMCATCGAVHNSALDEATARVLEITYNRHYMVSLEQAGMKLVVELKKLKVELKEEEQDDDEQLNNPGVKNVSH